MMNTTTSIRTCAILLAAFTVLPGVQASAQESPAFTLDRVTVEQVGERVFVHLMANGVASTLAEPEILEHRARLTLTLRRTTLATPLPIMTPRVEGLLDVSLEQRDGDVALIIDAESVGDHGLDPRPGGVVLWFEPAPVAPRTWTPAVIPIPVEPAVSDERTDPAPAPQEDDPATTLRAGISGLAAMVAAAAGRTLGATMRERDTLVLAIPATAVVLFLVLTWWWIGRRHSVAARAAAAEAPVSNGAAFAWAARTLMDEGLDVGGIARRTGIARDAVSLLLHGISPANPAAPGSPFRPAAGTAGTGGGGQPTASH